MIDEPTSNTTLFKLPPQVIYAILTFILGAIFSAGMWGGRSNAAIDSLTTSVTALAVKVDLLNTQFVNMNGDTRERLKGVEGAVSNLQEQVRDIRVTQQEEANRHGRP